jgi:hypothetical protein
VVSSNAEVRSMGGDGSLVGWYVGAEDGLPRRLPVHAAARDRYVDTFQRGTRTQQMIFIPDAGVYDTEGTVLPVPGKSGIVRQIPLPHKYEQLKELAAQTNPDGTPRHPLLKRGWELMLSTERTAKPVNLLCACGVTFGSRTIFDAHQGVCSAVGASVGPDVVPPPSASGVADAPAKSYSCDCGETFPSGILKAQHVRKEHTPKKRRGHRSEAA